MHGWQVVPMGLFVWWIIVDNGLERGCRMLEVMVEVKVVRWRRQNVSGYLWAVHIPTIESAQDGVLIIWD